MISFLNKRCVFPIGVDVGRSHIKVAQLGFDGSEIYLNAAACEQVPLEIEFETPSWQKCVAKTVKKLMSRSSLKGKQVVTAMPASDVFIEQIKLLPSAKNNLEKEIVKNVGERLPFESNDALIKHVVVENSGNDGSINVIVMAAERTKVTRHLAIYEKAGAEIKGMSVWPLAIINSYVSFFGRRGEDRDTTVLLIDIGSKQTNIVVCRFNKLLFARSIPIGFIKLEEQDIAGQLVYEAQACCRHFESVCQGQQIQRLVFLSGRSVGQNICDEIANLAQRMQIPAQVGDVLAAVDVQKGNSIDIDRRGYQVDWAAAFGLSLTGFNQVKKHKLSEVVENV
jgi:type IV pilus assembly protein PilM